MPDADDLAPRTHIALRPVGSPLPLGFFAFGTGVALTSLLELQVLTASHRVAVVLLTFTAPLELLGAVFAFLARDSGAGTALAVFGGSWVSTGTSLLLAPDGSRSAVTCAYDLALVAVLAVMALAARQGKPVLTVLLTLASVRFGASGLYESTGAAPAQQLAGLVGLIIVTFSLYGGLALPLEDGRGQTVLPLGRRGRARSALEDGLGAQLRGLDSEAGVRRQL